MRTPLPVLVAAVVALSMGLSVAAAWAQPAADAPAADAEDAPADEPVRLIDQEPWDRLQLDAANDNEVLEIVPLPSRVVPKDPKPNQKLRIRLIDNPRQQYDVEWRYIASLQLYEQMVLDEALRLIKSGDSREAWEYLDFLFKNYPDLPGLEQAREDYLYLEAGRLFREKKYDAALGVLEELYRLNDRYTTGTSNDLLSVLNVVVDNLVKGYVDEAKYLAARRLLDRIEATFRDSLADVVEKWRGELIDIAKSKGAEARKMLDEGRLFEARIASREVLEIWPTLPGADQLVNEIAEKFPVVVVGVAQASGDAVPASFDNWAERRTGRLTRRLLVEFDGHRPDGGQYSFPLGEVRLSDDRQHIEFDIDSQTNPNGIDGFDISRRVLALGDRTSPEYRPVFGWLLDTVSVEEVDHVDVRLRVPHVLPQALLQVPLLPPPAAASAGVLAEEDGMYRFALRDRGDVRFTVNSEDPKLAGAYDIFEHHYADSRAASHALRRGEVDVLDRVFPADVARLEREPNVVVQPYALPTMHLLLPNPDNEFTNNKTFRHALVYGIDRQSILDSVLLEGSRIEGCKVVSGPFPPGITASDSWAYGYDTQIEPRKYEPRLALTMVELAKRELTNLAKKRGRPAPQLKTLTLAHPAEDIARAACETIVEQLALVGVEVKLKELPPGETSDASGEWDLLFSEVAMWEPFVDASRLLGMETVARTRGDYVRAAQQRLEMAPNEAEGRRRLRELHLAMHHDVTVIPLWQMVNHRAHLRSITGLGESALYLYHDVAQWRRAAESTVAAK